MRSRRRAIGAVMPRVVTSKATPMAIPNAMMMPAREYRMVELVSTVSASLPAERFFMYLSSPLLDILFQWRDQ